MSVRIDKINLAIKTREDETAETLLLQEVNHREKVYADQKGCRIDFWPYERLAIIYRKRKEYRYEVEILERFLKRQNGRGTPAGKPGERLRQAHQLLATASGTVAPVEFSGCRFAAFDL